MKEKKEDILLAAEELFAIYGFAGTSVRMLSQKAKVNGAMISYYFGSKENVLETLISYRIDNVDQQLERICLLPLSAKDKLEQIIELFVEEACQYSDSYKIILRESLSSSNVGNIIQKASKRWNERITTIMKQGYEENLFKQADIELTVASLFGTVSYLLNSDSLISTQAVKLRDHTSDPTSHIYTPIFTDTTKGRIKKYLHELIKAHLYPSL